MKAAVDDRLRLYPDPPRNRCAKNWRSCIAAGRKISFAGMARMNCSRSRRGLLWRLVQSDKIKVKAEVTRATSIFHSRVIRCIRSWRKFTARSKIVGARQGFWHPACRAEKIPGMGFPCRADFHHHAQRPGRTRLATTELEAFCRAQQGVVVLDEAYVDFAEENALSLALKHPHVLVVAHLFQGLFALLPARRIFRRASRARSPRWIKSATATT